MELVLSAYEMPFDDINELMEYVTMLRERGDVTFFAYDLVDSGLITIHFAPHAVTEAVYCKLRFYEGN